MLGYALVILAGPACCGQVLADSLSFDTAGAQPAAAASAYWDTWDAFNYLGFASNFSVVKAILGKRELRDCTYIGPLVDR